MFAHDFPIVWLMISRQRPLLSYPIASAKKTFKKPHPSDIFHQVEELFQNIYNYHIKHQEKSHDITIFLIVLL